MFQCHPQLKLLPSKDGLQNVQEEVPLCLPGEPVCGGREGVCVCV